MTVHKPVSNILCMIKLKLMFYWVKMNNVGLCSIISCIKHKA